MLTLAFDPAAFGGADFFAADVRRLIDWAKASPPIEPGGAVLMPGELEDRVRAERRDAIPIDGGTFARIVAAGESVGVAAPR
jgi:uncharacterized oxidoreductase